MDKKKREVTCGHPERGYHCKGMCQSCYFKQWRAANPERVKELQARWGREHPYYWRTYKKKDRTEYNKQYYAKNRERLRETSAAYRCSKKETLMIQQREYRKTNPETTNRASSKSKRKNRSGLRQAVLDMFGNRCAKCGYDSDRNALQLDHIDGGGLRERKALGGSWGVYKRALTTPEDYQVLCANCNAIKRIENGELFRKHKL